MARGRARVTRRSASGVRAILQDPSMRAACQSVADGLASRVRARGSRTYGGSFGGLVRTESTNRGGVRGDRATATVVVAPPPPESVRYPDRDRFVTVQAVGREVT